MLHLPQGSSNAVIVGIDPGTTNLGLCTMEFDILTKEIKSTRAKTFDANKFIDKHCEQTILHGERFARIATHRKNILAVLLSCNVTYIAVESPFMSMRMPGAYGALVEALVAIKEAVYAFDRNKVIQLIEPSLVKKAIGAKGH